jgi:hypothetical protein
VWRKPVTREPWTVTEAGEERGDDGTPGSGSSLIFASLLLPQQSGIEQETKDVFINSSLSPKIKFRFPNNDQGLKTKDQRL